MADRPAKKQKLEESSSFTHFIKPREDAIQFAAPSVLIKVGKPPTDFTANEKLLRDNSDFFAAALKKEWQEGKQRTVELPEQDPETFNIYLNWLYSRRVFLDINASESYQDNRSNHMAVKAYALGDLLLDNDFKDATTDSLVVLSSTRHHGKFWLPCNEDRNMLYKKTPAGSAARKLLVQRMTHLSNGKILREDENPAILFDLAKSKLDNPGLQPSTVTFVNSAVACEFHVHAPGRENCYRTKYTQAAQHSTTVSTA